MENITLQLNNTSSRYLAIELASQYCAGGVYRDLVSYITVYAVWRE